MLQLNDILYYRKRYASSKLEEVTVVRLTKTTAELSDGQKVKYKPTDLNVKHFYPIEKWVNNVYLKLTEVEKIELEKQIEEENYEKSVKNFFKTHNFTFKEQCQIFELLNPTKNV